MKISFNASDIQFQSSLLNLRYIFQFLYFVVLKYKQRFNFLPSRQRDNYPFGAEKGSLNTHSSPKGHLGGTPGTAKRQPFKHL